MESFVWVEYQCMKCQELHRIRFKLRVNKTKSLHQLKRRVYTEGNIHIDDTAGQATIYADYYSRVEDIKRVVKNWMLKQYTIKPDTLIVEMCRA